MFSTMRSKVLLDNEQDVLLDEEQLDSLATGVGRTWPCISSWRMGGRSFKGEALNYVCLAVAGEEIGQEDVTMAFLTIEKHWRSSTG